MIVNQTGLCHEYDRPLLEAIAEAAEINPLQLQHKVNALCKNLDIDLAESPSSSSSSSTHLNQINKSNQSGDHETVG